ncbi:putative DNA-binding pseudobarrel domain superfamily [Helianthus debilis subsp. tardiflorus]
MLIFSYWNAGLEYVWVIFFFNKSIPSDAACKLWGVEMGPVNVDIHTDDGRIFNVGLSYSKGNFFLFYEWSNVTQHLRLSEGCFIVFNPIDCTTFKLTHFIDGVSGSSFWTYLLCTSAHFYVSYNLFLRILNYFCLYLLILKIVI